MPLYEYQCRTCGKVTEVRHGFDETVSEPCAECGGALTRRFSPAGIVFKGSGFYVTDSRKAAEGKGSVSKGQTAKGDGKTESATPSTSASDGAKETGPATSPPPASPKKDEGAAA